ncbi:hypothetical protein E3N88_33559 [Mikania micrantha]|uniref:Uncharacterized protein n=1 Tax=Mikania micrantha TaxID=192012 RepID=A0A5N6ME68_9ASTR|nr:hypothetical protein E3N88_33559 [Mikania micrantha]
MSGKRPYKNVLFPSQYQEPVRDWCGSKAKEVSKTVENTVVNEDESSDEYVFEIYLKFMKNEGFLIMVDEEKEKKDEAMEDDDDSLTFVTDEAFSS